MPPAERPDVDETFAPEVGSAAEPDDVDEDVELVECIVLSVGNTSGVLVDVIRIVDGAVTMLPAVSVSPAACIEVMTWVVPGVDSVT